MKFEPNYRIHPGKTLDDILGELGMSQTYLAWAMGYSLKHINQLIKGHTSITATMAVRLEKELGKPSAEFWLTRQMLYDLHAARKAEAQVSHITP